jgi:surface antigen
MRARILPAIFGLAVTLPAVAANWNFLEFSPASSFTEQDWELMGKTMDEALGKAADGDTRGWNNSQSGAYGTIQPLKTYEARGTTCRRTEIYNNTGGASGTSRFDFCRQADGTWKVAPRPRSAPGQATGN